MPASSSASLEIADPCVAAVRRFSRFYTQRLELLDRELLASGFTLSESRVLWELAQRQAQRAPLTASQLHTDLGLDPGYLSRLLRRLREAGLLRATVAPTDARAQRLSLTAAGRKAVAALEAASARQVATLLGPLHSTARQQLVDALTTAQALMHPSDNVAEWTMDPPAPGDIGWVVQRHAALYAQEFGWDTRFEALVARIGADFIDHFQPGREAGWIAKRDGVRLGCVFVVQAQPDEPGDDVADMSDVARLRMLLVEPAARGQGLGERLVAQAEAFASAAGYRKMVLWTNAVLRAAGALYARRGWQLVHEAPHPGFGQPQVSQTWEKDLVTGRS